MARTARGNSPPEDSQATGGREAILRATYDLVEAHGYHPVTVGDICKHAGVVRATFYVYFSNKLDAFTSVMARVIESLYETAGQRPAHDHEYARIVESNARYMQAWARDRHVLAQWFALSLIDETVGETYRTFRDRFESRIEQRLQRLIDTNRIPQADAGMLATVLSGMMESFVRRYLGPENSDAHIRTHFPTALRTISEAWYSTIYAERPPEFTYTTYGLDPTGTL